MVYQSSVRTSLFACLLALAHILTAAQPIQEEYNECPVCFVDFKDITSGVITPTCHESHRLCKGCFDTIQNSSNLCPLCRKDLVQAFIEYIPSAPPFEPDIPTEKLEKDVPASSSKTKLTPVHNPQKATLESQINIELADLCNRCVQSQGNRTQPMSRTERSLTIARNCFIINGALALLYKDKPLIIYGTPINWLYSGCISAATCIALDQLYFSRKKLFEKQTAYATK